MPQNEQVIKVEIEKFLEDIADFILAKSTENLVLYDAVDTGFLMRSGVIAKTTDGVKITFTAPYAEEIEFGREPSSELPSVKDIEKWAIRKLGIKPKRAKGVAYAIAKKIKEKGTQPRPYLRDSINEAKLKFKGKTDIK